MSRVALVRLVPFGKGWRDSRWERAEPVSDATSDRFQRQVQPGAKATGIEGALGFPFSR